MKMLAGISVSDSTIHRMTNYYGEQIDGSLCQELSSLQEPASEPEVVYAQVDGSMIFTDDKWQEVKVGRVFKASDCRANPNEQRGGRIEQSCYAAYLGYYQRFTERFEPLIAHEMSANRELVFITDGALWIRNWINEKFPDALQILDFYHACEHVGEFSKNVAKKIPENSSQWYEIQKKALLEGQVEAVIDRIKSMKLPDDTAAELSREQLLNYLTDNRYRMNYKVYKNKGLMIGSGAIEAAHRTVVQRRMKLSGQRWSDKGANNLLNLRVCKMSNKWNILVDEIRRKKAA